MCRATHVPLCPAINLIWIGIETMHLRISDISIKWGLAIAILLLSGVAWAFQTHWLPAVRSWVDAQIVSGRARSVENDHESGHAADGSDEHGHDHPGHVESEALHLSEQARRNIGLTDENLQAVTLQSFTKTLNIPARVVERPGRTRIQVAAPMTGVVTAVHAVQGEAVLPGDLLFEVRLTHEDLVQAQTAFLQTLGELDVEEREVARLEKLDERGVIAGKTLLERQYSKQKLEATLSAHREALLLHGLSSEQIDSIVETRRLVRELEVLAPRLGPLDAVGHRRTNHIKPVSTSETGTSEAVAEDPLMVQQVNAQTGTMVRAGDALCVLVDLDDLYIEGRAFEQDADQITRAAQMQAAGEPGWGVTAVREDGGRGTDTVDHLTIVYVDNEVESESRALRFFVDLPNRIVHETIGEHGHRFLTWRFKPGQRMQLRVPIERWQKQLVLPVDAVAQQGPEHYVFRQNGDHFDRVPVHVEYQDQFSAVIANDGALFPGDVVALTGAHQMQMALKNKAGGGIDPHAGHSH